MYNTVKKNDFIDAFKKSESYKNKYSYDALEVLFDYYDDVGVEFDVVWIVCEWTEYESEAELLEEYGADEIGDVQGLILEVPKYGENGAYNGFSLLLQI